MIIYSVHQSLINNTIIVNEFVIAHHKIRCTTLCDQYTLHTDTSNTTKFQHHHQRVPRTATLHELPGPPSTCNLKQLHYIKFQHHHQRVTRTATLNTRFQVSITPRKFNIPKLHCLIRSTSTIRHQPHQK